MRRVFFMTKSTLFNLLIRETSHFLCYARLLNMTYEANKSAFFREMQFCLHCYTVVSYQALFRLSVYKIPAVYLLGAKNVCFCTIRDFGTPTKYCCVRHKTFTTLNIGKHVESSFENTYTVWWCIFKATGGTNFKK